MASLSSLDVRASSQRGWLFVLRWPLEHIGGVNVALGTAAQPTPVLRSEMGFCLALTSSRARTVVGNLRPQQFCRTVGRLSI